MKRSTLVPWLIVLLLLAILIYREFNRKIPVDIGKVKEHAISMKEAEGYTKAFTEAKAALARQLPNPGYLDSNFNLPQCELFNKDAIGAILNKPGTEGLRVYLGLNGKKEVCFVLVPVTGKGKDITERLTVQYNSWMPGVSSARAGYPDDAEAIERGQRCPHMCDVESPLSNP
ncbi:hypothetical protein [Chitinophaga barathri]|uniref:Uncharacterized protein n=1 Tax=Chitinophaga barathri TaxID=1647451 RepID=A0A3N4MCW1_9BACT|nr:hypothetical protein [Chitinophaga barathri]RPD39377.1 hypothetical protein EG028_19835 [Chitinophaga barathri]